MPPGQGSLIGALSDAHGLQYWSMTTLPLSQVKSHLSEIADEVARTHERVRITKNGRDYVVLLAQARVASAEHDIEGGDVLDEGDVRSLLVTRRSGAAE